MSTIISVQARQILDSRGNPTIEVDVIDKQWDPWKGCSSFRSIHRDP